MASVLLILTSLIPMQTVHASVWMQKGIHIIIVCALLWVTRAQPHQVRMQTPHAIGRRHTFRTEWVVCLVILMAQALIIQAALQSLLPTAPQRPDYQTLVVHSLFFQIPLLILFACEEELLFRAALLRLFDAYRGNRTTFVLCSAILFGMQHIQWGGAVVVQATAAGVWLALYYRRHRRIVATIALHAVYNGTILIAQL